MKGMEDEQSRTIVPFILKMADRDPSTRDTIIKQAVFTELQSSLYTRFSSTVAFNLLKQSKLDPNFKNPLDCGKTPLMYFLRELDVNFTQEVLALKADAAIKDDDGRTVLHHLIDAFAYGWSRREKQNYENIRAIIDLLLSKGVDINAKGKGGTATFSALCYRYNDIQRHLELKGGTI
jgi:ankyrin repeat protein